jgi:hypothetical protein
VPDEAPAGTLIGQKIHMEDTATATGAEHGCLLKESVFLHNVQRAATNPLRQRIFDEVRAVARGKPLA